jgi:DNA-binding winged helix-turn-helix (wHTH) protein
LPSKGATLKARYLGRCIAFADFELYPEAGKLYKLGYRVAKARPQEVALLTVLVEQAGVKVTKKEIEARLWPNESPPKNRLNVVVCDVRSALGDTNRDPRRYIATLGEDGYCFIHPIKRVERATGSYNDVEGEQAYRFGLRCLENREDASLREAVTWFKRAISKNPSHALAWVGLADAYIISAIHCVDAPQDAFPKARAAAEEAARIDASLPDAIVSLATVKLCFDRDWCAAEKMFVQALNANPTLPYAHNGIALLQLATGRAAEGIASLEQAQRHNPLSAPIYAILCHMLCFTRRYEDAINIGQKAVLADPESCITRCCLGSALLCLDRYDEALPHFQKARILSHDSKLYVGFCAHALARAGKVGEAKRALETLVSLPRHEYAPSYLVGLIHLGLGHSDEAIDWLNRACEERSHWMIFLNVDPVFDRLRSHPRFPSLLQKVGFNVAATIPPGDGSSFAPKG